MKKPTLTAEHERLFKLGFSIHLLHEASKRPVEMGWASGKRKTWADLLNAYKPGMNLGVRLGSTSKVAGHYLAVIDCDVKSSSPHHVAEMEIKLGEIFKGKAPVVLSGRGNGSRHVYVLTREPARARRLAQSSEKVKVEMPSAMTPSKFERANLTGEELAAGIRLRAAWEISLMGEGQQVVLPPSIHPDTGSAYLWEVPLRGSGDLPFFEPPEGSGAGKASDLGTSVRSTFKPVPVDLVGSRLSSRVVDQIISGDGVEDRSSALLGICNHLVKAKFSDEEILTVLTDRENFIGETAYDHAQTQDRARAAEWVRKYTLEKSKTGLLAERVFEAEIEIAPNLSDAEVKNQAKALQAEDWRIHLKRGGQFGDGPPKSLAENILRILTNAVSPQLFKRDLFASRDFYGVDTPWGGKRGAAITDEDAAHIRVWLGENWRFEPSKDLIFDAIAILASRNAFHPLRDQFEALPAWDGKGRLDTFLRDHFQAEGSDEYLAQVFRKWLVAAVSRVYTPGLKFDWMPIFEGPQGVGKSSIGRILAGEAYFLDSIPNLSDKDAALGLQGTFIVEMSELASLRKNELEIVKGFLTRQIDKVRPPYGKRWLESPRQCVFFGTTNAAEYLRDDTGNRRFNPVKVGRLNFEALIRDRDQLWAEAIFIARNDLEARLDLEGEAAEFVKTLWKEKTVSDESTLMVEALQLFISDEKLKPKGDRFSFEKFPISKLFGALGPLDLWKYENRNAQHAAKSLRVLGGEKMKLSGNIFWKLDI